MSDTNPTAVPETNPPSTYFRGIGEMVFYFEEARYAIAWLGQDEDKDFISKQRTQDYNNVARDFVALAEKHKEWEAVAFRFTELSTRFSYLLACTPASVNNVNYLGSSDEGKVEHWTVELMDEFVNEAEAISALAGNLRASEVATKA